MQEVVFYTEPQNSELPRVLNGNSTIIAEFRISREEFKSLNRAFYIWDPNTLNQPTSGTFGIAIPIGSEAWLFWLTICTNGIIQVSRKINYDEWTEWTTI